MDCQSLSFHQTNSSSWLPSALQCWQGLELYSQKSYHLTKELPLIPGMAAAARRIKLDEIRMLLFEGWFLKDNVGYSADIIFCERKT